MSDHASAAEARATYVTSLEDELRSAEINDPGRVKVIEAEIQRAKGAPSQRSEKPTATADAPKARRAKTADASSD